MNSGQKCVYMPKEEKKQISTLHVQNKICIS